MRHLNLASNLATVVALLILAQPAQAQAGCENVSGTITAHFTGPTTIEGTVTGGLEGAVSAVILDIRPSGQGALHVQLQHTFVTVDGDELFTMDQAVLSPVAPPLYRMNTRYTIVGGTGAFEMATGFLLNHGEVDLESGSVSLSYHGRICDIQ